MQKTLNEARIIKEKIHEADAVIVGAGAGLSASAGLNYAGQEFKEEFKDYIQKYGFKDLYSSSFYQYPTPEEHWHTWAKHVEMIRFRPNAKPLYIQLLNLIKDKDYFVITTNVDGQFIKAGFDPNRYFEVQGNYGLMQCSKGCHDTLYDDEEIVHQTSAIHYRDIKLVTPLIPHCPICGAPMDIHVRKDSTFQQDSHWYEMAEKYDDFLEKHEGDKIVLLELGVGFNTPTIIRYPFERMTYQQKNTYLIRINADYDQGMTENYNKTYTFKEDINTVFSKLLKEEK